VHDDILKEFEELAASGLTYFSRNRLQRVVSCINAAAIDQPRINAVEFGIALGGSAIAICQYHERQWVDVGRASSTTAVNYIGNLPKKPGEIISLLRRVG
jgi:hypothetical protein